MPEQATCTNSKFILAKIKTGLELGWETEL